jgi:Ca-activated chloride channel family protein
MNRFQFGLLLILAGKLLSADSGVIIPSGHTSPDPAVLAIDSMNIRVVIDNGHAAVRLREVFHNKTADVLEGSYSLALPDGAAVSDFAVWDDVTRIPGVILERKRASELYAQLRNEAVDPGLLQSGEVTESQAPGEARHSSEFAVKIVPIPAFGYKRLEAEYRQNLAMTQLSSNFALPLKPVTYAAQTVANFSLSIELSDPQSIVEFRSANKLFPLTVSTQNDHLVKAFFEGTNILLNEDFSLTYKLRDQQTIKVQTYRTGERNEPGYFETSALLSGGPAKPAASLPRSVVVLFDTSLSMQWEKLERSFQSLEAALRALKPTDTFNVITFNSATERCSPRPVSATPEAIAKALDFVKASRLRGGTNLQRAFAAAFEQTQPASYVILLSDGESTEGIVPSRRFGDWLEQTWSTLPAAQRPGLYTLAIGDDADVRLMQRIAAHNGVFEQVGSAEPLDFKLAAFIRKIGVAPLDHVELTIAPRPNTSFIYRLGQDNFPGARASWVGQYAQPLAANFTVSNITAHVTLPAVDMQHPYLPATWARARVDALLEKIDRQGEDKASIDEIIRLSRKYKFVTPYTSFLAAPRALLRPRLIRPGDPVLRVRTDPSIVSLVALFPFGPINSLHYLKDEDIWQTRFVAPDDMPDGAHTVRLILRDRAGHVYREQKTFLISSHPPVVRVHLDSARVHPGQQLTLNVQASQTTRTLTAQLYGASPLYLKWDDSQKSNTGILTVPASLPAGRYSIHVTAEDIAHNISHQEVPIEVLP